jgi:hypothetical protein
MQVGLSDPSHMGYASPIKRDGVNKVSKVKRREKREYPASPLITARPQRYSVLLNDQLTTIQLADDYLLQLENILLDIRHSRFRNSKERGKGRSNDKNNELKFILENRTTLSGEAVDRDLRCVVQGNPQVHFQIPQLPDLLKSSVGDAVLFSRENRRTKEFASVLTSMEDSSAERSQSLNHGLRRLGIRVVSSNPIDGYLFSCDENDWQEIEKSLKVVINGTKVQANGNTTSITLKKVTAIADELFLFTNSLVLQDDQPTERLIQHALNIVAEQRQFVAQQQGLVNQLIKGMVEYHHDDFARNAASAVSVFLSGVKHSYQVLDYAISGQANFLGLTVRNILTD